jgi:5-methylcytosine-specific restriction endonuclease McrA
MNRNHDDIRLYNSIRWRKLRTWKLTRDPLCWYCLEIGRITAADTVDHRKAHKGNEKLFWDSDNLQSLCSTCHNAIAQEKDAKGYAVGCGVDGYPIDPGHPFNNRGKKG